jgi:hypothetical protein
MDTPESFNEITNRMFRVDIPDHPGFENWYIKLSPRVRDLFHAVMEADVTPELILSAQEVPEQEWRGLPFVAAIAGGNPDPAVRLDLTNVVLWEIMLEVESFNEGDPGE